jgi:copper chaperone
MARYRVYIPAIHCNHCKMRITEALKEIGEKKFEIDVEKKLLFIETANFDKVKEKLEEIDYPPERVEEA